MGITLDSPLFQRISSSKIIAVLVVESVTEAISTVGALSKGGVNAVELTLRTPAALDALKAIRQEFPDILAGVGTILRPDQADAAKAAGADFGVSPGINPVVVRHANDIGLPFGPGVMTPTDIDQAVDCGCHLLKYFPATSAGGLAHLDNIAAPYRHLGISFIPLGGVTANNFRDWLDSPMISAVGGSWLAPRPLINAAEWGEISRLAHDAVSSARLSS